MTFDVIAFDADDTLWHSEDGFHANEQRFVELVAPFAASGVDVKAALTAVERENLAVFGYGVITKGDLIHQSNKVATSGLAHHFSDIEILLEKDAETYDRIFKKLGTATERVCMVGNSVRSDILPVLSLGGSAVHIPYPLLWELEHVDAIDVSPHEGSFAKLASIAELPDWLGLD